jgi:hypothetical protein
MAVNSDKNIEFIKSQSSRTIVAKGGETPIVSLHVEPTKVIQSERETVVVSRETETSVVSECCTIPLGQAGDSGEEVSFLALCESSLNVMDIVRISTAESNKVLKVTDNISGPAVGIVVEKATSTTARIRVTGIVDGYFGLLPGKRVFVSPAGLPTGTVPTVNYLQHLGVALTAETFILNPQGVRVKRV